MNSNRCFVCGSGNSISEGINKGLWDYLKNEITISCNYNYKFFEATIQTFYDYKFYDSMKEELDKLPLVIAPATHQLISRCTNTNVYLLPIDNTNKLICHGKDAWYKREWYKGHWCANFALSVAISFGFKDIYLLGCDHCEIDGHTHFYKELNHPNQKTKELMNHGVGKKKIKTKKGTKEVYNTSSYNTLGTLKYWEPFTKIKDVNIYNVSPLSKIHHFEKISYNTLFAKLDKEPQNILQSIQREKIQDIILTRL